MKIIYIKSANRFCYVDNDDYEKFGHLTFYMNDTGYAIHGEKINRKMKHSRLHRLITNAPKGVEVDHINGHTLDNRKSNLRLSTRSKQMQNTKMYDNNTSGLKGVCWHKQREKWYARISFNKKTISLGLFNSFENAAEAYRKALHHGEFARPDSFEKMIPRNKA